MKSGNLKFLEPSGSLQACSGAALPLSLAVIILHKWGELHRLKNQFSWLRQPVSSGRYNLKLKKHVNSMANCKYHVPNTQLSVPTHAQLRHMLKFIKNHLKTPTCFGLRPSSGSYNVLAKVTIILTTFGRMLSVVMWQHGVLFVSGCTWRASEFTCSS